MRVAQPPATSIGRRLVRAAGFGIGIAVVLALVWIAANWTFLTRIVTYPFDDELSAVAWYEPRERIPGAFTTPLPSVEPAKLGFDPTRLAAAAKHAIERDSSAFLVLRNGEIGCEVYGEGCGADVQTISFSMAKTLVALLLGTAVARGEIGALDAAIASFGGEWRDAPRGAIPLRPSPRCRRWWDSRRHRASGSGRSAVRGPRPGGSPRG